MFATCGYNFLADGNALTPSPLLPDSYTSTKLENGIYDHWNVNRDINTPYSPDIPEDWTVSTIMNGKFNGTIDAGNFDEVLNKIQGFRLKRRKLTDQNWITLAYFPISADDNKFTYHDNFAVSGIEYEYAFVPIIDGDEGTYISDTIKAKFAGVFICDEQTIYRFWANVNYGTGEQIQKVGVFEPFGRRYPVVVSNSVINYYKGTIGGTVLPYNYLSNKKLDRVAMMEERKVLLNFMNNKKAKILKDPNGNLWLIYFSDSPVISFYQNYYNGLADVTANYVEIGDAESQTDLYNAGLIKGIE